ncbi:protein N-lysine methyltransferase METTL21A-like [Branchiostoma floridae]|uniref:Protein N-lysine methyltransferase METTL21A-like n=1 Tax=Branchiostoma floridae TaxID=7739 RepID=A0A9J7MRL4_BRAFL|nr:protein N-lysine methyltransferase METTL21A-like [Branchiostoma floridae]
MSSENSKERAQELMRKRCRMRPYYFVGREIVIWERDVGENTEEAIGKRIWPGGEAFAEYLESGELSLEDKKVIELGAGTGLVGIVASLLGADVTITDLPDILPCTAENVTSNTMEGQSCVRPLTWGKNLAAFPTYGVHYDYVIGIEVVYIEDVFQDLITTIKYLSDKDTRILIGYQIRVKERDRAALVLLGAIIFFRRTVLYQGFHNDDEEEDTPYVNDKKIMEALPSCQTIEQAAVEDTEQ